ncbi:MAG: 4-(cytidine 5'-diphospho)-2-C-methyl-D-erythritol kinase [Rhizobiales bacterium]|nr:4-(cytidine 5'-diphospho)-2-C-methyl-D-erythritol kinase [Hyphomicrobiales bacterium]
MTETARAKINLALHVTARRGDGYHELDSLVAFAAIGDELTITPASRTTLQITGPFAAQLTGADGNIVLDAVEAMRQAWPHQFAPVAISLTKKLPVASGIGGGSADAAGVLRGLQQLFGPVEERARLKKIALQLGADVPVCCLQRACRMSSIGQQLEVLGDGPSFAAVMVNPGIAVSTPEVFAALGLMPGTPAMPGLPPLPATPARQDWIGWLAQCRNDLQAPAISLVPEIDVVLKSIGAAPGCLMHRMSGSGATCFGVFEDQSSAQRAADELSALNKNWWVRATTIA